MRAFTAGLIVVAVLAASATFADDIDRSIAPDEDRFVNTPLPDIDLTTGAGTRTSLAALSAGRPLLLALVFTRCTGVCSPFLRSWRDADRRVPNARSVSRLILSFDPRDSHADMAELARHLGVADDPRWTFAVAALEDVKRLADAVGFWYDWQPSQQQFDHPAMLAAARHGRVVRLLVGAIVSPARLDELAREASGEFVPSYPLPNRARFRCVQYDSRTGRLSLDWGAAVLLIPLAAITVTTAVMFCAGGAHRNRRSLACPPKL